MKKITLAFASVSLAVLLTACGEKKDENTTKEAPKTEQAHKNEENNTQDSKRPDQKAAVEKLIALFKANDIAGIAKMVEYPLQRESPAPSIKNEKEFIANFSSLVPESIAKAIGNSTPDQWDAVGSRGVMYSNQSDINLWLSDDNSKIITLSAESAGNEKAKNDAIKEGSEKLHADLGNIKKPVYVLTTKKYKIRIDELKDGTFRYAAWNNNKADMSQKPDIIVKNGKQIIEGSLSIEHFEFKNGNYTYEIFPINMAASGEVGSLTVYENGKEILNHETKTIFPK